ncbi:hypothetical protein [Chryseobacterium sp.]|uniref:hypothetical protein n=1 Tax=Chryseobacterium sp. TaxID=1871047 RepID=UPI000ED56DC5|nr:hypothetical protein [Chryseobacterium sp.]HCM35927.1 hypothetical protein [Chryseobacterium sp.]
MEKKRRNDEKGTLTFSQFIVRAFSGFLLFISSFYLAELHILEDVNDDAQLIPTNNESLPELSKAKIYIISDAVVSNLDSVSNYEVVNVKSANSGKPETKDFAHAHKKKSVAESKTTSEKKKDQDRKEITFSTGKQDSHFLFCNLIPTVSVPVQVMPKYFFIPNDIIKIHASFKFLKHKSKYFYSPVIITRYRTFFSGRAPPFFS